ncbi:hypothetical protein HZH66_015505 [Vespula vulgaris]|uniref:Odorant receptor n=1 Tax=Vespula vulgaris TaxID=7454 RepID=A0A834IWM4_VESVU|nr:hypothetical protein HZH66_015505 [Vespula vulgaris]
MSCDDKMAQQNEESLIRLVIDFSNTLRAMTFSKRLLRLQGFGLWKFVTVYSYRLYFLRNATSEYKLPYKIKPLLEPYNAKSYAFGCIHEFLRIIMIISGYLGTDCFFTSTGFHLSGQLAVLKCKVKNVLNDTHGSRQGIRKIILGHHRLIRLVDLLEDSFNIIIGQHLFGTTILLCISSYRMLSALDFRSTSKVIDLNKRTLNCAGIWPESIHEPVFIFFSVYLAVHCTMGVLSITDNMSDMEYIIGCIEEHMFNFMTLLKICICRIKSNSLAEFLKDIKVDLIPGRYKTDEEKIAFLNYNNFSLKFVKVTIVSCVIAATLYYLAGLAANIEMVVANSSYGYRLPYKSRSLIEPTNLIIYVCLCLYQFLLVLIIIFGYVGTDCLLISLVLHVSGLFSALSCKVKHVLNNPENRRSRIKKLILRHIRLIR